MAEELLIDQALAITEAAQPVRFGDSIPVTPAQAMVASVYDAAVGAAKGWNEPGVAERFARMALRAGIAQHEIDAAFERARGAASDAPVD